MKVECGFARVNNGRHCWSHGCCIVCPARKIEVKIIEPPVAKPYDPKTYKLLDKDTMILYNPNLVSRRKRIISA